MCIFWALIHIIQIQTIDAWKGAHERSGITILMVFSKFSSLLQGMDRDFKGMHGNSQPKCIIYWVSHYRKMKCVLEKHDARHGIMVWPHRAVVKSWEGLIYVVMHAFHKSNHHRGSSMASRGKSPRLKGDPNFLCPLSMSFFYDEHTPCKSPCSNLTLFRVHLPYLGDYLHSLGINAHNSNSNNRCMTRCTTTVWKTILVLFSTFSCLLQGMGRYSKEMCENSQP